MKPIIPIIAAALATGAQAKIYDFGDFKIDFPKQPKVRRVSNEEGRTQYTQYSAVSPVAWLQIVQYMPMGDSNSLEERVIYHRGLIVGSAKSTPEISHFIFMGYPAMQARFFDGKDYWSEIFIYTLTNTYSLAVVSGNRKQSADLFNHFINSFELEDEQTEVRPPTSSAGRY
jgi:hypothetical protein